MASKVDRRRLNDGNAAMEVDISKPLTAVEIRSQMASLSDGICALQSLDDLGSEAANQNAWDDMLELQRRYGVLEVKLKALEGK